MSKPETAPYFKNIQSLRASAALLVLTFHIHAIEGKYFINHAVPGILGLFGTCGVDLFFVTSGFVMATVSRGQFGSLKAAADFLKWRVIRIYPIYWIYSSLVLAVMFVQPQWVNSSTGHHAEILQSLLLFPSGTLPVILQGWTLIFEMFFYLVFAALLACVAERFLVASLLTWAAATGGFAYLLTYAHAVSPALRIVGDPLVLEFIAGCLCALICPVIRRPWPFLLLALGALGLFGSFIVGEQIGSSVAVQWRALIFGAPAIFLVLGAVSLEAQTKIAAPRFLCVLGDASYSLYLSHVLVISAVGRLYAPLAPALGSSLGTLLCFVAAIGVGHLSFKYVEQPVSSLLKRKLTATHQVSVA